MRKIHKEFKISYEKALEEIENKTKVYKEKLLESFLTEGFIKEDSAYLPVENSNVVGRDYRIRRSSHEDFLDQINNSYNVVGRKFEIGGIYKADLNPTLPYEVSGIRPVLILSVDSHRVIALTLSTKTKVDIFNRQILIEKSKYPDLPKDSVVCTEVVKTLDKSRIFEQITALEKDDMEKILKTFVNNIVGDKYKHIIAGGNESNLTSEIYTKEVKESKEVKATTKKKTKPEIEPKIEVTSEDVTMEDVLKTVNENAAIYKGDKPLSKAQEKIANTTKFYAPKLNIILTDEEAMNIVTKRIEYMRSKGSRLIFDNPLMYGDSDFKSGDISVTFNEGDEFQGKNQFYTHFSFLPFNVSYTCGDKHTPHDNIATSYLVDLMHEKYGINYDILYAISYVKQITNAYYRFEEGIEKYAYKLNRQLSLIHKKANNPEELVKSGLKAFNFDELEDAERVEYAYNRNPNNDK